MFYLFDSLKCMLALALFAVCSGCAAVLAPPMIVGIPTNGLQEYGPAVDKNELDYENLKHDYEQNDCVAWDRYIHSMLDTERRKHPADTDTSLILRACRDGGEYDCAEPPLNAELKELITRAGKPNVHCVKHPQIN